jgi:hypothetical protein
VVDGRQHPVCCKAVPARTFRHKGLVERPGGKAWWKGLVVVVRGLFGCAGSVKLRRQRRSRVVMSRRCGRGVYTVSVLSVCTYAYTHTHVQVHRTYTQAVHGQDITHAHTHAAHGRHACTRMHTRMYVVVTQAYTHAYTDVRGRHAGIHACTWSSRMHTRCTGSRTCIHAKYGGSVSLPQLRRRCGAGHPQPGRQDYWADS